MNNRIKELRRALKKNQLEFGELLGVSKSAVQKWESGENTPTDTAIALMCSKTQVNEHWLRTGEGEPFLQLSREDALTAYVARVVGGKTTDIERRIIQFMAATDVEEWETLAGAIRRFADEINKPDTE